MKNVSNTILRGDSIGITVIIERPGRATYTIAGISECINGSQNAKRSSNLRFRHDSQDILDTIDSDDCMLYPCDSHHCISGDKFRPGRALVSQIVNLVMVSDSGFSSAQRSLSIVHGEQKSPCSLSI